MGQMQMVVFEDSQTQMTKFPLTDWTSVMRLRSSDPVSRGSWGEADIDEG